MPDGEFEKKAIQPPHSVDKVGMLGSNEEIIDSIPTQEFEVTSPSGEETGKTATALPAKPRKQKKSDFLFGFGEATQLRLKVLFEDSDLINPSTDRAPSPSAKTPNPGSQPANRRGEATAKFLALADATSTRLKELLQGSKLASDKTDDADGKSAVPGGVEAWTLPESKLTQQERKAKKDFLHKTGPRSQAMRPTKTREGTHSKPKKVSKVEKWIGRCGLTMILLFFMWQLGHSFVAQQLVNSGLQQLSNGHLDDALTSFNHAIQVDGDSANAYFSRGNAYRKKGELKKAFDDYSTSLKLSPNRIDVLNRRAALCLQLENYQQAANDYTVLFGLAPADVKPQMYDNRAGAYVGLGQYDRAWQDYKVALKANPKGIKPLTGSAFCLTQLGRYAEAVSNYNALIELDPHDYDSYLGRGYCNQKQRNFTQAAQDFQTVLKQSPGNKQALCYRADLNAEQGLSSEAFADLAAVLQLDPKYGRALMLRADLYTRKGDYVNALKDYDQADKIPLFTGRLALRLDRARVYQKMKEYEKAAADYSTAIGLAPNDYLPYVSRAQCYQQLKDYKKAIADCTTALELSPKKADIYQLRGTMHEQFGNPISAYKDYTNAISLDRKNIDSYVYRGRYCLAKQDFAAALADFDQALKIDPKSASAQAGRDQTVAASTAPKLAVESAPVPPANNLDLSKFSTANLIKGGYSRLKKGSAEEAVSMLSEAVRRNRNDAISRRYLGYALLRAGRPSEATEQFEALRKLGRLLPSDQLAMQQAEQSESMESGESNAADTPAVSQYQATIAANPKDWDSKYNLVVIYAKSGRTNDALRECAAGMNEAPANSEEQQRFHRLYLSLETASLNQGHAKPVQSRQRIEPKKPIKETSDD